MVSGNFSYFQNFTVHYVHYVQSHSPLKTKKRTEARTCPVLFRGRYWDSPVSYWPIFSLFLVHCVRVQEVSVGVNSSQFPFCFVKWQIWVRCCRCTCNTCLSSMAVLHPVL